MRKDELRARLVQTNFKMFSLQKQLDGTRLQYEAACVSNNNEKADVCRTATHDLTDLYLDTLAEQMLLCKSIAEILD